MSESEEMYLITIAHLKEEGCEGPVPLSRLAEDLSVVPVSANQMVKKLEAAGFVRYRPYKGVSLTEKGAQAAAQVLRHRRLWETFLVEHLGVGLQEADALACRMEHITANPIGDRLSSFLGYPDYTPDGKPIPGSSGGYSLRHRIPLPDLGVGAKGMVDFIEGDGEMQQFLASQGIQRGVEVNLLARGTQGSVLVGVQGSKVCLAPEIAGCVRIERTVPDTAMVPAGSGQGGGSRQ